LRDTRIACALEKVRRLVHILWNNSAPEIVDASLIARRRVFIITALLHECERARVVGLHPDALPVEIAERITIGGFASAAVCLQD